MKVKSLSHIQLFVTPWTVAYHAPLVHGIFQARILDWVAISFSRGASWAMDENRMSCIDRQILYHWATWEAAQNGATLQIAER